LRAAGQRRSLLNLEYVVSGGGATELYIMLSKASDVARRREMKPVQENQTHVYDGRIGGWLQLPAIGLVLSVVGILFGLSKPNPAGTTIVGVLWILVELMLGVLLLAVFYSYLFAFSFLGKALGKIRRHTRKLMFLWLTMFALRTPIAYVIARLNVPPNYIMDFLEIRRFVWNMAVAIVWGVYFIRSERVRLTFAVDFPAAKPPNGALATPVALAPIVALLVSGLLVPVLIVVLAGPFGTMLGHHNRKLNLAFDAGTVALLAGAAAGPVLAVFALIRARRRSKDVSVIAVCVLVLSVALAVFAGLCGLIMYYNIGD
jgi:hypothetical protein